MMLYKATHLERVWVCVDCALIIASGECGDAEETERHGRRMDEHTAGGGMVTLGDSDLTEEFSRRECHTCGESDAGTRHEAYEHVEVTGLLHNPDKVFSAYVRCALWASVADVDMVGGLYEGEPFDRVFGPDDFAPGAQVDMRNDLIDFLFLVAQRVPVAGNIAAEQMGHDFWLTRNRHGAGFWDRGLGGLGEELTELAHSYGSSDLYVGDDGKVWVS